LTNNTKINVIVNILLLAAKGVAAIWSSSLSLIASLVDSALDLLCTIIIWTTNKIVGWRLTRLKKKFPVGRRRLEPLGILVFSIIMVVSFLQILQESIQKLLPSGDHSTATLPPAAIFSMVATIVVKGTIWIGCARVKTTQVQALAQDCKTDVYFNTLSLLFPLIGHKTNVWWLDPVGATILSLFIIYDWAGTCIENVTRLTGEAADDRTTRKLMFMAWRFSPLVGGYKMMKAYHAGDGVWVEVDILMDEKTPLREAHDVAETLQYCMESLKEVDRAFVTMDCKSTVMNIADDDTNEGQILRKDRQDTRRIMSEGKVFVLYCVRLRCFVFGLHCFRFRLHGYGSPWIWIW
jgi:cation diffusion facilitator family transporter